LNFYFPEVFRNTEKIVAKQQCKSRTVFSRREGG